MDRDRQRREDRAIRRQRQNKAVRLYTAWQVPWETMPPLAAPTPELTRARRSR